MLSKTLPFGEAKNFRLRCPKFIKEKASIDLITDTVDGLDTDKKTVKLREGDPVKYDKLLIATGGKQKVPPIMALTSVGVHFLRSNVD